MMNDKELNKSCISDDANDDIREILELELKNGAQYLVLGKS